MLEGASNSIYFAIQSNCTATHSNSESKLQLEARSNSKPGVALGFVNSIFQVLFLFEEGQVTISIGI